MGNVKKEQNGYIWGSATVCICCFRIMFLLLFLIAPFFCFSQQSNVFVARGIYIYGEFNIGLELVKKTDTAIFIGTGIDFYIGNESKFNFGIAIISDNNELIVSKKAIKKPKLNKVNNLIAEEKNKTFHSKAAYKESPFHRPASEILFKGVGVIITATSSRINLKYNRTTIACRFENIKIAISKHKVCSPKPIYEWRAENLSIIKNYFSRPPPLTWGG